ncbi:hypothetical protein GCM10027596_30790 [Nocardioides korecus]
MSDVRIGTWNVEYARGVEKNRRRSAHLRSLAAQVWVLTETHDDLDLSSTHTALHSTQRYATPGGRWTTLWTSLPVMECLPTDDPSRCVAARLDAGDAGELVVYGTVLPWNGDVGPDEKNPGRGWSEFRRVVAHQGQEWAELRRSFPFATLVVAGDLNQDLGGRHFYGSRKCRALLNVELARADLTCLTTTGNFAQGLLEHPPIDHICASPGRSNLTVTRVDGWNRTIDGVALSDHGGTLVDLAVPRSQQPEPGR